MKPWTELRAEHEQRLSAHPNGDVIRARAVAQLLTDLVVEISVLEEECNELRRQLGKAVQGTREGGGESA